MVDLLNLYVQSVHLDLSDLRAYLFTNTYGHPLNGKYLERLMNRICLKAGVNHYTAYDIRNSSAALLFAYGAEEDEVAGQLGIGIKFVQRYNKESFNKEAIQDAGRLVALSVKLPSQHMDMA
jgi:integrase